MAPGANLYGSSFMFLTGLPGGGVSASLCFLPQLTLVVPISQARSNKMVVFICFLFVIITIYLKKSLFGIKT
jgi:hypothetical protein